LGLLTAGNRPEWFKIREQLRKTDPCNEKLFNNIEKCPFIVCLDDMSPSDMREAAANIIGGDANNRYYDKMIQLVVFANGRAGFNVEHTPIDAPPVGRMVDMSLGLLKDLGANDYSSSGGDGPSSLPIPQKLEWRPFPDLVRMFPRLQKEWNQFNGDLDLQLMQFRGFGSDWLKQQQVSPDSFVQMVLQLAFYRLHNKHTATYETGTTRQFYHGRTETCRSCSIESDAFVKAICSESSKPSEVVALLRKAMDGHKKYMLDAVHGKGCDRHLLGLYLLAKEANEEIPELFKDVAWERGRYFRVSTSNMTSQTYIPGFGPVVNDGYGICYGIRSDMIYAGITARQNSPETSALKMRQTIENAFLELKQILENVNTPRAKL
jgi:carnitine O-acetyltransferase